MSKRPERPASRDARGGRSTGGPRRASTSKSAPGARRSKDDDAPPRRSARPAREEGEPRGTRGGGRPTRGPERTDRSGGSERPAGPRGPRRDDRSGPGRSGPRTAGPRGPRSEERPSRPGRAAGPGRPRPERDERAPRAGGKGPAKPWPRQSRDERTFKEGDPLSRRPFRKGERSNRFSLPNPANEGLVRLNRYLAQAGVGSRREADEFITSGAVTVNGKVVTELGTKVAPGDVVHFGGQKLGLEELRYVLLNKPKNTITTTDDPQERHTVMSLITGSGPERLYPVGRLDRHTTGVLLLTNDGDLAKRLTHPSHGAEKIYHATLDKSMSAADLAKLVEGVELEDGFAQADEANYVADSGRKEVGIKLHMGRNRIVRRMFAALGYEVVKLDRVVFAGLTKKDLPRGRWRHLTEKEVVFLKRMKEAPKTSPSQRGGRRLRSSGLAED